MTDELADAETGGREEFLMQFDPGTVKHLGLHMYSTLPPVIGELVSNAWDAGAREVYVSLPPDFVADDSVITVEDDGDGMDDEDIRSAYLIVGRDRRKAEQSDKRKREPERPVMGRKGIGKFAGFGIAGRVEIETAKDGMVSRFIMDYGQLDSPGGQREVKFPPLAPTGNVTKGTRITLRDIGRFRTRRIDIVGLRRGLARRFSVLGDAFTVYVNGRPITPEERDLLRYLEVGEDGQKYLWKYDEEVEPNSGWRVSGWIGSLDRSSGSIDGIQRGIVIMARGKLVQEPFVFGASVGQQYALSYLVGELHAEFVDASEDTIGTTRNSLVWDAPANEALLRWGRRQVEVIARQWAERRRKDKERRLEKNPKYQRFREKAEEIDNKRALKIADKLVRDVVEKNIVEEDSQTDEVIDLCLDFLEFDAFWDLAEDLTATPLSEPSTLNKLFREWEIVEAKEMARVTQGRIIAITKLQEMVENNALEVPTLHQFLKEFPWVLDAKWHLVDDEVRYSELLRQRYPESDEIPESDRRIDFLCVREGDELVVVEIKRPHSKASRKELNQLEDYVIFMRTHLRTTTDEQYSPTTVVGYLLCGSVVNVPEVREKMASMGRDNMYVRKYSDLLGMVENLHREFLDRYNSLREIRKSQRLNI